MHPAGVLPYLDIPFQHGSPAVLKRMRRPAHAENTLQRIAAWRREQPELVVRSSFIVGFPGETEAEFVELLAWLDEAQLDRVGCFKYSPVQDATANALPDPVPEPIKQERYDRFMQKAAQISRARLQARVGNRYALLIDEGSGGDRPWGAALPRAPQIDGVVHLAAQGT